MDFLTESRRCFPIDLFFFPISRVRTRLFQDHSPAREVSKQENIGLGEIFDALERVTSKCRDLAEKAAANLRVQCGERDEGAVPLKFLSMTFRLVGHKLEPKAAAASIEVEFGVHQMQLR